MLDADTPAADRALSQAPSFAAAIDAALGLTMPSWPLQNVVAVNPFWQQRGRPFTDVMREVSPVIGAETYMPLAFYLDQYGTGRISERSLSAVLAQAKSKIGLDAESLDTFVRASRRQQVEHHYDQSFAGWLDQRQPGSNWQRAIIDQVGMFAGAYFDNGQAVAPFPWRSLSFWEAWKAAQSLGGVADSWALPGLKALLAAAAGLSARDHIGHMLGRLGISSAAAQARYLARLMAEVLGWASQFQWRDWQHGLGYSVAGVGGTEDLLAVRLSYDLLLTRGFQDGTMSGDLSEFHAWQQSLHRERDPSGASARHLALQEIWQEALELSYQEGLAALLKRPKLPPRAARFHAIFCIDVRSEPIRRCLERASPQLRTSGFAGFFGLPITFQSQAQEQASARLPVLLSPRLEVRDGDDLSRGPRRQQVSEFIKSMRKGAISSFSFVELFGGIGLLQMAERCLELIRPQPKLPATTTSEPSRWTISGINGVPLDTLGKVEHTLGILRHLGLKDDFASLILLVGHGSTSRNNAFAASLACGACGGHAGDLNARLLASWLNDPRVRSGLKTRGVQVPATTWFCAALHETTTDKIAVLDAHLVPSTHQEALSEFAEVARCAGAVARHERASRWRSMPANQAAQRACNWAETRPEWGLAGNGALIVGPRDVTLGVDLGGRAFLHDYDWRKDDDFKTLELIMTAPMVVAHWINMQYYASTVAPEVYGAGDKTIHNIINESGVICGNGGDLRIGLPLQSVHDGTKFVHEPLRLSVVIAAPRPAIESVIAKHENVRLLIEHEWVHILQIDDRGDLLRRAPGGAYACL